MLRKVDAMTDLEQHIQQTPLMDTHEHLNKEVQYVEQGPDILQELFDNYITADLRVAGATEAAVKRLLDASDPALGARFQGVNEAWERCRHTGYGEAVSLIANQVYLMEEITSDALSAAGDRALQLHRPGERLRILQEVGNLDHVQVDDFDWRCAPDLSGPEFFLYDLSWASFCCGNISPEALNEATGITVNSLESLRASLEELFARNAPCAIAVKTQHAYNRTLRWEEREEADAARVLEKSLSGRELEVGERNCLGDWCWARGVELAILHNLPFKIHTGYYAGHSTMPVDHIRSGHLCGLLARYPQARFVLMHSAYPYSAELVALAKHYPNVIVDLCWAWSIDPYSTADFVRRMIHAVPANKLFAFGGDTFWPHAAVAYAAQARRGLTGALQDEVDDGLLTEHQAIALATRYMRTNQEACFDFSGTRAAIRAAL